MEFDGIIGTQKVDRRAAAPARDDARPATFALNRQTPVRRPADRPARAVAAKGDGFRFESILPVGASASANVAVAPNGMSRQAVLPAFGRTSRVLKRLAGKLRGFGQGQGPGLGPGRLAVLAPIALSFLVAAILVSWSLSLSVSDAVAPIALPAETASESDLLLSFISPGLQADDESETIDVPKTPVTLTVTTYTIRRGDSLGGIATKFGVSLDSLLSMNGIRNASRVAAGTVLKIPNMSGIVHKVARGENLSAISTRYKVPVVTILDANDLASETLAVGMTLFIPGARLSQSEMNRALGKLVIWPVRGRLSSYYGYRTSPFSGARQFHNGLDIVADYGTGVKAAMEGSVADTGYNTVYGNYVILSHPGGYQTMYGHMSKVNVRKGASLKQGAIIGAVGNSGISTGSHLHFSLFKGGSAINPLKLLN